MSQWECRFAAEERLTVMLDSFEDSDLPNEELAVVLKESIDRLFSRPITFRNYEGNHVTMFLRSGVDKVEVLSGRPPPASDEGYWGWWMQVAGGRTVYVRIVGELFVSD